MYDAMHRDSRLKQAGLGKLGGNVPTPTEPNYSKCLAAGGAKELKRSLHLLLQLSYRSKMKIEIRCAWQVCF